MNKIVDNFDKINRLLNFQNEDDFYFLEIIKRRKDNPDLLISKKLIRDYFLSPGDLERNKESIKQICELNNARAYLRLNIRNYRDIAYRMNVEISKYLMNEQYRNCENLFRSVCGSCHSDKSKKWVVDIDTKDEHLLKEYKLMILSLITEFSRGYPLNKETLKEAISIINIGTCAQISLPNKLCLITLPTIHGYHIISPPFDIKKFNQHCLIAKLEVPEVHKDNPTLLYFNGVSDSITKQILENTKYY